MVWLLDREKMMNTWTLRFNNFKNSSYWKKIIAFADDIDLEAAPRSEYQHELRRFKKLTEYLSSQFEALDPELTPSGMAVHLRDHAGSCVRHLQNGVQELPDANNYLDEMITFIAPYLILDAKKARHIEKDIERSQINVDKNNAAIESFTTKLLGNDKGSIKNEINSLHTQFLLQRKEIDIFHERLTQGNAKNRSIIKKIADAEEFVTESHAKIDAFIQEQTARILTLKEEIESLLPKATSSGLAAACGKLKRGAKILGILYSVLFITTIASLIGIFWFTHDFGADKSYQDWILSVAYRMPLTLPIIWLAVFFSKRRSESHRLEQEYAHKESLAQSYEGYRIQIEGIDDTEGKLIERLLDTAITALGHNPANTLDKKHGDNPPIWDAAKGTADKAKGN